MVAFDGLVGLVLFLVWLCCVVDAVLSDADQVRNLPKPLWVLIVVFVPDVGSVLWLLAGRPRSAAGVPSPFAGRPSRPAGGRSRPVAPDDDPEFLASLDRGHLDAWEKDLRRREEELRRKENDGGEG